MNEKNHAQPDGPLDEELGEVSPEELAAAAALRDGLSGASPPPHSDAAFALGLRATVKGAAPDPAAAERAVERALEAHARARRRRIWGPVLIAAVVLLAAVPAARLFVTTDVAAPRPETADALFDGPFEDGTASDRTTVIARARARSYFAHRIVEEGGAR